MKNRYYNYVMKVQFVIILIFTLYIIFISFFRITDYYHDEPVWKVISALLLFTSIMLGICWKLMDDIKKSSWILYEVVLAAIMATYAFFLHNIITLKLIKEIDFRKTFAILQGFFRTLRIANPDLYYIRMVFCIVFTTIMIAYLLVSIITNAITFFKTKDFFAN